MAKANSQTHPLPWWAAGILLGLVQVLAVSLSFSLDITPQFVNTNTKVLESIAPGYIENHPIKENTEYERTGSSWWFAVGIFIGAFIAAVHLRIWKIQIISQLWQQNHNTPIVVRMIIGFFGGFLMLFGAGIASTIQSPHYSLISNFFARNPGRRCALPHSLQTYLSDIFFVGFSRPSGFGRGKPR